MWHAVEYALDIKRFNICDLKKKFITNCPKKSN